MKITKLLPILALLLSGLAAIACSAGGYQDSNAPASQQSGAKRTTGSKKAAQSAAAATGDSTAGTTTG